jgi:hypothetical protein
MRTNQLLAKACAIALAAPLAAAAAVNSPICAGRFYTQGQEAEGINPPDVHIRNQTLPLLGPGESMMFDLDYTVEPGGIPNAFWCVQAGKLSADSAEALSVTFTAPDEIYQTTVIRLGVQLADGRGYVAGDSLYIQLAQTGFTGTVTDADNNPLADVTVTIGNQTVTTDAAGTFTVTGLSPGSYSLSVTLAGADFTPIAVDLPLLERVCTDTAGTEGSGENTGVRKAAKVIICHKGKTKSVSESALAAHLAHGDTEGPCAADSPPPGNSGGKVDDDDDDDDDERDDDDRDEDNDAGGNGDNIAVCHIPGGDMSKAHTIWVGAPAVQAHLNHGDFLGECSDGGTQPPSGTVLSVCVEPLIIEPPGVDPIDPEPDDETTTTVEVGYELCGSLAHANKQCAAPGQDVTQSFPGIAYSADKGIKPKFKVPDLTAKGAIGTVTVVEDTQNLLNSATIDSNETFAVTQNADTGNLEVTLPDSGIQFTTMPTQVRQAYTNEAPGVTVGDSGEVKIVTEHGVKVVTFPALEVPSALVTALQNLKILQAPASPGVAAFLQGVGLHFDTMTINADGSLTVYPGMFKLEKKKYLAKPGLMTVPAPEGTEENTLLPADSELLPDGNGSLLQLCFKNKAGKLRLQTLYPAAAEVETLVKMKHAGVKLDAAGPGTLSFKANRQTQIVLFDYAVTQGELPASGGLEFHAIEDANDDGVEDYQVVYANGDTQKAFVIDSQ